MTTSTEASRWHRWALWLPGLLVALAAGAATAHGLYEVALGAGVPPAIAWLYPVITDGLALVAYVSTIRLRDGDRSYAWCVVVLAAGLSGLAQAAYLADGVGFAPPALRFGVGAWPAIAAAIVAHLLFLLGAEHPAEPRAVSTDIDVAVQGSTQYAVSNSAVQPRVQASNGQPGHSSKPGLSNGGAPEPTPHPKPTSQASSGARDRARAVARRHAAQHGTFPSVRQLQQLADVARGTAANALQELRERPNQLHVVNETTNPASDQ